MNKTWVLIVLTKEQFELIAIEDLFVLQQHEHHLPYLS